MREIEVKVEGEGDRTRGLGAWQQKHAFQQTKSGLQPKPVLSPRERIVKKKDNVRVCVRCESVVPQSNGKLSPPLCPHQPTVQTKRRRRRPQVVSQVPKSPFRAPRSNSTTTTAHQSHAGGDCGGGLCVARLVISFPPILPQNADYAADVKVKYRASSFVVMPWWCDHALVTWWCVSKSSLIKRRRREVNAREGSSWSSPGYRQCCRRSSSAGP